VVFLIRRRGEHFAARRISAVAIYPCEGARDPEAEEALARALEAGGAERVRHLCRHQLPAEQCWLEGDGWCLAYA
jgi:protein-L-isoaspartate(D-aspartate) O-methyltransferase